MNRYRYLLNKKNKQKISNKETEELFSIIKKDGVERYISEITDYNKDYIKVNQQKAWNKLGITQNLQRSRSPLLFSKFLKVAAIFIFMLAFSAFFSQFKTLDNNLSIIKTVVGRDITTTVLLPDGSKVILAKNSSITYFENYSCENRQLELRGKAYLDIKGSCENPLILKTGKLYTKMSKAIVNVDCGRDKVDITIKEGKISFMNENKAKVSCPLIKLVKANSAKETDNFVSNQRVIYSNHSGLKRTEYREDFFAWKDRIMNFNNYNLYEVATAISEWYGVEVIIKGRVNNRESFNIDSVNPSLDSLTNVLFAKDTYLIEFDSTRHILKIKVRS